jgi:tetratricopeptide (TPR) repeat protein
MTIETEALIGRVWDFEDPAGSAQAFAELADRADTPQASLALRTQQARALGLSGDFEGAATLLDECGAAVGELAGPAADYARARLSIERGRLLNSTGDPTVAGPLFEQARELAAALGAAALAVDALHMLAIVAGAMDGPDASMAINRQAVDEALASSDPDARLWLGSLLNNLGWDLLDVGRAEEALGVFQQALQARIDTGRTGRLHEARWAIGRALRELGRTDEAIELQQKLLASHPDDGHVHEELAALYRTVGNVPEADRHSVRARQLLRPRSITES